MSPKSVSGLTAWVVICWKDLGRRKFCSSWFLVYSQAVFSSLAVNALVLCGEEPWFWCPEHFMAWRSGEKLLEEKLPVTRIASLKLVHSLLNIVCCRDFCHLEQSSRIHNNWAIIPDISGSMNCPNLWRIYNGTAFRRLYKATLSCLAGEVTMGTQEDSWALHRACWGHT